MPKFGNPTPSESIFGTETPTTYSADSGLYTLATLFIPSFDGFITGLRLFLDDADSAVHPFAIYRAGTAFPIYVGIWRGNPSPTATTGVSGQFRNAWMHPQLPVEASTYYYAAMYSSGSPYWVTAHRFTAGVGTANISSPADGTTPYHNGAFIVNAAMQYPTSTFHENWYGVDVLYLKK